MEILLSYLSDNAIPLFLGASFTGGVSVFYLVMQRTRRRRMAD